MAIMLSVSGLAATANARPNQKKEDVTMTRQGNYIFTLSDKVIRTPVKYRNRFSIVIAADLYMPKSFDETRQYPGLIVGSPYGGVKEQGAGIYAQNMAERGFIALALDPSYNGYSGGEPRQLSSPDLLVEDFRAAVDYPAPRPFVN